ncbi:MAG: DNA mismatch repair endonuclease MutL, partial [Elusimicrobiota bacterium]
MNKIKILPEEVVNKIAAGEVVERPASVVKELVENSIDATSSRINVEFEQAGKKLIRVTDNGFGMSRNDALLSVKRHATSKITLFSDLQQITTLGFRGEALPSICTVSRCRLVTKTAQDKQASELIMEGEKIISECECAGVNGTMVEVSDLFFNLPARKKFLKADSTEQAHIIRTIEEAALSHSEVGFSVVGNKKVIFNSPPNSKLEERFSDLFGNNLLGGMLPVNYDSARIKITGFVSSVENSQPNKNLQYFFINSRPITNRLLSQALYDSYRDALPIGRHPVALILMEIDPKAIDINVHPTKRIVKFSDEFEIYKALNLAINESLSKKRAVPFNLVKTQPQSRTVYEIPQRSPAENQIKSEPLAFNFSSGVIQPPPSTHLRILGQMHNTYIIAESEEGLLLFDQHAANERVLYEKFLSAAKNPDKLPVQELLIPLTLDIAPYEMELLKPHLNSINLLGFEITEFGKNSLALKSLPSIMGNLKRV